MICERSDVVIVPFPFTEQAQAKNRPTVVLSDRTFNIGGYSILAMITTKQEPVWVGDILIKDYLGAGLRVPCLIRFKIFTLDNRLITKKIGSLGIVDARQVKKQLRAIWD